MLQEGYIKLNKVKGVRIRNYELNSIGYYNYLHLFRIFKSNSELLTRLEGIHSNLQADKDELKKIDGYRVLNQRIKQFLMAKSIIEKLHIAFKDAMEKFKEN